MRATAACRTEEEKAKGKEGASSSALKAIETGALKRKVDGKDIRPSNKVIVTPSDKPPKKMSPPKSSHEAGKGLMMTLGPISQGLDHRLLTHKDYAAEMIESIIKDKDMDLCAEQMTEELARVSLFLFPFLFLFIHCSIC